MKVNQFLYKRRKDWVAGTLALVAMQAGGARADTTTTTIEPAQAGPIAQSTAAAGPSLMDKLNDKLVLNYWGYYNGGALNDPGRGLEPTTDGTPDATNPQKVENLVNAGVRLDKDTSLYVGVHSYYYPGGHANADTGQLDGQQSIDMLDPIITLSRANLINTAGVKTKGYFALSPAMTTNDYSKPHHLLGYASIIENTTWDVPHSKLTLGVYSYVRGYVKGSDADDASRTYRLVIAPTVNYQITETFAANIWWDFVDTRRYGGTGFFGGMTQVAPQDVEPGFNWDINSRISFNPILNIYPSKPTLQATSIQAILTAKAF